MGDDLCGWRREKKGIDRVGGNIGEGGRQGRGRGREKCLTVMIREGG